MVLTQESVFFSLLEFLPDLTAAWDEGICTVNLCPASDTGVPTFADTDTVCAAGVPAIQPRSVKTSTDSPKYTSQKE